MKTSKNLIIRFLILSFSVFFHINVIADELVTGEKTISLITSENNSLVIGKVIFENKDDKHTYTISWQDDVFSDEFLSMRPFKCIHFEKQMICNLVYPYEKLGYITSDDLMDLEYDLLFLHKSAQEYGINAWNGLYYKLTQTDKGFAGRLMEVDLNVLAAPPEDGILRPVTDDMLHDADPSVHVYPKLTIE